MMRVTICIRNAFWLREHCEDQVRPAQPMSSAVERCMLVGRRRKGAGGVVNFVSIEGRVEKCLQKVGKAGRSDTRDSSDTRLV